MFLAKVVGTVWSTKKSPDLEGIRFLVVHPYDLEKEPTRNIVIVADRGPFGRGRVIDVSAAAAERVILPPAGVYVGTGQGNDRGQVADHDGDDASGRALLRERGDAAALHSVIRVNVALARAQLARQSVFAYDRTSRGAQDYQHVVEELLGTRRAVASSGTVIPFRHQRRGPGGRKEPKSGRAAQADSR